MHENTYWINKDEAGRHVQFIKHVCIQYVQYIYTDDMYILKTVF